MPLLLQAFPKKLHQRLALIEALIGDGSALLMLRLIWSIIKATFHRVEQAA
jgi:hypothetical protein